MTATRSFRGATLDDALSAACNGLGAPMEELHYVVVDEGSNGGVEIEAEVDPVAVLGLFLAETFRAGDLEITARLDLQPEAFEAIPRESPSSGVAEAPSHRRCRLAGGPTNPPREPTGATERGSKGTAQHSYQRSMENLLHVARR